MIFATTPDSGPWKCGPDRRLPLRLSLGAHDFSQRFSKAAITVFGTGQELSQAAQVEQRPCIVNFTPVP